MKLPCKVGDVVYEAFLSGITEMTVTDFYIDRDEKLIRLDRSWGNESLYDLSDFGETLFTTRQEAEKAQEMKR